MVLVVPVCMPGAVWSSVLCRCPCDSSVGALTADTYACAREIYTLSRVDMCVCLATVIALLSQWCSGSWLLQKHHQKSSPVCGAIL